MKPILAFSIVLLILAIAYVSLYLYFQHRIEKKHKEYQARLNNLKIDENETKPETKSN
jgi:type VI protein secretion system component VasF